MLVGCDLKMVIRHGNGKEKILEEALVLGRVELVEVSRRSDKTIMV